MSKNKDNQKGKGKGEQPKPDKGYKPKAGPKSGGAKGRNRKVKPTNIVSPEEGKKIWKAFKAESALVKAETRVHEAWDKVESLKWDLVILSIFATISGINITDFEKLKDEMYNESSIFSSGKEEFHILKRNFFNKAYSALKGEALIVSEEDRQQLSELTNHVWFGGREVNYQNGIINNS